MKYRLLALFILLCACDVSAQNKDNYFAGIGINIPGASLVRDKSILRHLDLGLGVNINKADETYLNTRLSAFLDLRPYFLFRKNLIFIPVDAGWSVYNGTQPKNDNMQRSGFYSSFGVGYAYLINKRGMGPFISFAMNGYTEQHHLTDPGVAPAGRNYGIYDGSLQMSLGFKF